MAESVLLSSFVNSRIILLLLGTVSTPAKNVNRSTTVRCCIRLLTKCARYVHFSIVLNAALRRKRVKIIPFCVQQIALSAAAHMPKSDLPFEFNHKKGSVTTGNAVVQSVSSDGQTVLETSDGTPPARWSDKRDGSPSVGINTVERTRSDGDDDLDGRNPHNRISNENNRVYGSYPSWHTLATNTEMDDLFRNIINRYVNSYNYVRPVRDCCNIEAVVVSDV